jgi:hypothetical protein
LCFLQMHQAEISAVQSHIKEQPACPSETPAESVCGC